MRRFFFQICRQIDNLNSFKWTFLKNENRRLLESSSENASENTFGQMPHPIHNSSDIVAILEAGVTSMHIFPKQNSI